MSGLSPQAAQVAVDLGVDPRGLGAHATLEGALQEALRVRAQAPALTRGERRSDARYGVSRAG